MCFHYLRCILRPSFHYLFSLPVVHTVSLISLPFYFIKNLQYTFPLTNIILLPTLSTPSNKRSDILDPFVHPTWLETGFKHHYNLHHHNISASHATNTHETKMSTRRTWIGKQESPPSPPCHKTCQESLYFLFLRVTTERDSKRLTFTRRMVQKVERRR